MRKLERLFRPLKDPCASNVRHDPVEILVIAFGPKQNSDLWGALSRRAVVRVDKGEQHTPFG